jgi:hypothetical protein
MERRRIKPEASFEERLAHMAQECRKKAKALPPGLEREEMIRKARQAETAAQLNQWAASPGLRPPE